jgi:hypothetical protein
VDISAESTDFVRSCVRYLIPNYKTHDALFLAINTCLRLRNTDKKLKDDILRVLIPKLNLQAIDGSPPGDPSAGSGWDALFPLHEQHRSKIVKKHGKLSKATRKKGDSRSFGTLSAKDLTEAIEEGGDETNGLNARELARTTMEGLNVRPLPVFAPTPSKITEFGASASSSSRDIDRPHQSDVEQDCTGKSSPVVAEGVSKTSSMSSSPLSSVHKSSRVPGITSVFEGYLDKKNELGKWQKRYFRLLQIVGNDPDRVEHRLLWYANATSKEEKNRLDVLSSTKVAFRLPPATLKRGVHGRWELHDASSMVNTSAAVLHKDPKQEGLEFTVQTVQRDLCMRTADVGTMVKWANAIEGCFVERLEE